MSPLLILFLFASPYWFVGAVTGNDVSIGFIETMPRVLASSEISTSKGTAKTTACGIAFVLNRHCRKTCQTRKAQANHDGRGCDESHGSPSVGIRRHLRSHHDVPDVTTIGDDKEQKRLQHVKPLSGCAGEIDRRAILSLVSGVMAGTAVAGGPGDPLAQPAHAAAPGGGDELYRTNILTNPVLEKLRIWEQAEADEIKYGGELERGDAGNKGKVDAYPKLLVPIVVISNELETIEQLLKVNGSKEDQLSSWRQIQKLLEQSKYKKVEFKKIFNAYGDNIYYSDPDRANLYLGGGAVPKTEQSLVYLLRNEILTNVEALKVEVDYLLDHPDDESTEDLMVYSSAALQAMRRYLDVVPPGELNKARAML